MARYRTILIGCGIAAGLREKTSSRVKLTHLPALSRHPRLRLDAVVDPDPAARRLALRRWKISSAFEHLEQALAESWDCAIVASPTPCHVRQIDLLIDAGVRAILAEKPMADSSRDAARLLAKARKRGVTLLVHYPRRYAPALQDLGSSIRKGLIGKPLSVHAPYGKGFRHIAVHSLDLLNHWFGPFTNVHAVASLLNPPEPDSPLVQLAGPGMPATVFQPVRWRYYPLMDLDILGEEGRVRIVDLATRLEIYRTKKSRLYSGEYELRRTSSRATGFESGTRRILDRMARVMDSDRPEQDDSEIYLARVCDAVESSLAKKRQLTI